VVFEMVRSAR